VAAKARGFSLVELAVVILVLAIAAGAVTLRLGGPLRAARLRDLTDEIVAFDRLSRTYAREQDQAVRLEVDLACGRFRRTDAHGRETIGREVQLPGGWRIARLLVGREDLGAGAATIRYSRQGLTPTYALLLEDPGGTGRWLLVAGLTGQVLEPNDEEEVRNTLAALQARPDAR